MPRTIVPLSPLLFMGASPLPSLASNQLVHPLGQSVFLCQTYMNSHHTLDLFKHLSTAQVSFWSQIRWHMPVIPALTWGKQEDQVFKVILTYLGSLKAASYTKPYLQHTHTRESLVSRVFSSMLIRGTATFCSSCSLPVCDLPLYIATGAVLGGYTP